MKRSCRTLIVDWKLLIQRERKNLPNFEIVSNKIDLVGFSLMILNSEELYENEVFMKFYPNNLWNWKHSLRFFSNIHSDSAVHMMYSIFNSYHKPKIHLQLTTYIRWKSETDDILPNISDEIMLTLLFLSQFGGNYSPIVQLTICATVHFGIQYISRSLRVRIKCASGNKRKFNDRSKRWFRKA